MKTLGTGTKKGTGSATTATVKQQAFMKVQTCFIKMK